jgi:hypothetical protein
MLIPADKTGDISDNKARAPMPFNIFITGLLIVQKETIFRLTHHSIGQARTIIIHRPVSVSAICHSFDSRLG